MLKILLIFLHVPSDVITDVIGIWSVFLESFVYLKRNFVTMRVVRLASDDRSLIWNLRLESEYSERLGLVAL